MTRDGLTNRPVATVALCVKCRKPTNAPMPVRWIESNCGPGTTLWACPTHVVELVPHPVDGELDSGV